jgi:hypothetical protein
MAGMDNGWFLAERPSRRERTSCAGPPDLPHDFRKVKTNRSLALVFGRRLLYAVDDQLLDHDLSLRQL